MKRRIVWGPQSLLPKSSDPGIAKYKLCCLKCRPFGYTGYLLSLFEKILATVARPESIAKIRMRVIDTPDASPDAIPDAGCMRSYVR